MSRLVVDRTAAATGLIVAAAAAAWWLGSTRLALEGGTDAARSAAGVLRALWLARAIAVAITAPRVAAVRGAAGGIAAAIGSIVPAWPLVALAWAAGRDSALLLVGAEAALVAGGAALAGIGAALRRVIVRSEIALDAATVAGIAVAALSWFALVGG